jgi:hypothetical protein
MVIPGPLEGRSLSPGRVQRGPGAPRNDGLGWAVSDLGRRPFLGQTGAPPFLFLQEKYRLAGLPEPSSSKAARSRARQKESR